MKGEYDCSKHGKIGDPNCRECWENLKRLTEDKNAHLVVDRKDKKC